MSVVKRRSVVALTIVGLMLLAFGFSTSASAYPPDQAPSLSASASAVTQGGSVTVTGSHFQGLVTLTAAGRSGSMSLGTAMAGTDGTFSANVTLPAGDFPPGSYTITATDKFGDVETISVSVVSGSKPSSPNSGGGGGLATTGVAVVGIGGLGLVLLLGGGLMLMAGKRRKAIV